MPGAGEPLVSLWSRLSSERPLCRGMGASRSGRGLETRGPWALSSASSPQRMLPGLWASASMGILWEIQILGRFPRPS